MIQRIRNLWFWSSISREDVKANPTSYSLRQINKEEVGHLGYIVGLTEEESAFNATLNINNRDTKLN